MYKGEEGVERQIYHVSVASQVNVYIQRILENEAPRELNGLNTVENKIATHPLSTHLGLNIFYSFCKFNIHTYNIAYNTNGIRMKVERLSTILENH